MLTKKLTLTDYLNRETDYEDRCEFVDGEIIEMLPDRPGNLLISLFLLLQFAQIVPLSWLRRMDMELVIANRIRMPDSLVLGEDLAIALATSGGSRITEEMLPPLLAVEVVSPGKANTDRDYRYKRSEYGAGGVSEYWLVDPEQQKVSVLALVDGWYEVEEFTSEIVIRSPLFPPLQLTAAQVLNPRQSE
jgi:Uma2 family endonuclease